MPGPSRARRSNRSALQNGYSLRDFCTALSETAPYCPRRGLSRMLRSYFAWTGACLLALFAAFNCTAQESRGSITGKVTDPQNAVIPGASVVVTNTATNVARRTNTSETGYYEVTFLDPGA